MLDYLIHIDIITKTYRPYIERGVYLRGFPNLLHSQWILTNPVVNFFL